MKTPQYTITSLILNYLIKYELAVADINHFPLPEKYKISLHEKYDAEAFLQFLNNILSQYKTGKIVIVLDNARIHHC